MATINKRDKLTLGLAIGLLLPLFILIMIFVASGTDVSLADYLKTMWRVNALSLMLSFSVLPNLIFFGIFNKLKYDLAMRGVMMATVIYALLMLLIKLI
ncbi:MAG: hypothetical protein ACK5JS_07035 [Mangrovibacterium sp.]